MTASAGWCVQCGGLVRREMVEATTLAGPRNWVPGQWSRCFQGCSASVVPVEWLRAWEHALQVMVLTEPLASSWEGKVPYVVVSVWSGPAATEPQPPTPEEIMDHAVGLGILG